MKMGILEHQGLSTAYLRAEYVKMKADVGHQSLFRYLPALFTDGKVGCGAGERRLSVNLSLKHGRRSLLGLP